MGRRVAHLTVGLGKGGAETMLYQVLKYRTGENTQQVISFGASHYYEDKIREMGIPVTELPLRKHPVSAIFRLVKLLRGTDTLCCWMYHANFIGYLAAKLARVPRIVWCVRHSNLEPSLNNRMTLILNRICARWSKNVDVIAYNGRQARAVHEAVGYAAEKGCVLDNGCNLEEYAPDGGARAQILDELGLDSTKKLVLSVTKATPIKDVPTFLAAFGALRQAEPNTVAVLCGGGIEAANKALMESCAENGLTPGRDIFLLGLRHDVPKLLAACDVYVLHSAAEAFPNALLQAMSSGCLCLTTDVGDARRILARDSCVVPPRDASALCAGIKKLLALDASPAEQMRMENRQRIQEHFDIREIVRQYEALY